MSDIGFTIPTWPFLVIAVATGLPTIGFGRWAARADGSSRAIALCLSVLSGADRGVQRRRRRRADLGLRVAFG